MNNSNLSLPSVVDGITGSNNIVDLCKTVYYEVDMEMSHCYSGHT